jgi:hypothetical protein
MKKIYSSALILACLLESNFVFSQGENINPGRQTAWWTTGNNGTNPVSNFIGTIDVRDFVIRTSNVERARVLSTGNIGIGNVNPASSLDLSGDLALREGTALALVDGANNNVAITGEQSHYRITGPTAAFSVSGFTGGNNGQLLTVINASTQTMTLVNNATSTAANRIQTGYGANINIVTGGTATFIYNSTIARWVLTANTGIAGREWSLLGNTGTVATTNFIGTTDAVDWVIRTSNVERVRVLAAGNVGIGTTVPAVKLAVNGAGTNVYATDVWVENNQHVQGNEALTQGGRGRLRVGTAWGYVGTYAEGSSTGVANDLVVGSSSGYVRVGPNANSNQHLRWANSLLRDNQGGSIELGGNDLLGFGGTGTPYIDWHINDGYTRDFDIRMIGQTDANGPIQTWYTWKNSGTPTLYRYLDLDWIGTYDCWADVSAWRYWANASDWLYWDVVNDLDAIDNMKPKAAIDPKSGKDVLIYDPTTAPDFLARKSKSDDGSDSYIYDVGAVANFSLGAVRQLRAETKTANEGQDARIARLEKIVAELTGKEAKAIEFANKATVYTGVTRYVVMDARVTDVSTLGVTPINADVSFKIVDRTKGSFTILLDKPSNTDVLFLYTGKLEY